MLRKAPFAPSVHFIPASFAEFLDASQISELAIQMSHPETGVEIKDRKYL
jgi:hypothetical protein